MVVGLIVIDYMQLCFLHIVFEQLPSSTSIIYSVDQFISIMMVIGT